MYVCKISFLSWIINRSRVPFVQRSVTWKILQNIMICMHANKSCVLTSLCGNGPARTCPKRTCDAWCVGRWCWGYGATWLQGRRRLESMIPDLPRTCPTRTPSLIYSTCHRGGSGNHPLPRPPHLQKTRPGRRLRRPSLSRTITNWGLGLVLSLGYLSAFLTRYCDPQITTSFSCHCLTIFKNTIV